MVFVWGDGRWPLSIYKENIFQIKVENEWFPYSLETKQGLPQNVREGFALAQKGLKVLYLERKLLFAWRYALEILREDDEKHKAWFLLRVINQLFFKAEM